MEVQVNIRMQHCAFSMDLFSRFLIISWHIFDCINNIKIHWNLTDDYFSQATRIIKINPKWPIDRAVPRGGVIKADWTASDFPKYISADSLAVVGCLELRGLAERPPLPLSPSRECFSALATRVNSVDEHKSSWKNFPSVGRARTIRNRQLYRSSRQPEKGEGGPRRGLKGWSWNCGPHSRVKAAVLRSRIDPRLPPLYVWGFVASKNCERAGSKGPGYASRRTDRGGWKVVVWGRVGSRGNISCVSWTPCEQGQTLAGLDPRWTTISGSVKNNRTENRLRFSRPNFFKGNGIRLRQEVESVKWLLLLA